MINMVMSPSSLSFSLCDTHTRVQVLAGADIESGIEVMSFWLELGTTLSLIRVERDHMAAWLTDWLAEKLGTGNTHEGKPDSRGNIRTMYFWM